MRALAIDFETASEERGSACSVGLAWVMDGVVTRVEERLIRPRSMRFSAMSIAIHGIRPEHVEDAPEFPEVMDEFAEDIATLPMIAHNAAFDFSVWRGALDQYRMAYPDVTYFCTLKMVQKVWPHLPSHRLNVVADHLRLAFRHHTAGEDAAVAAQAAIGVAGTLGAIDLHDIADRIRMTPGRLHARGYEPCSCRKR
ncbi:3'-5' exonuclease [Gellertiella hungarica]|uniref:DNA polymerase-3 subunit epsilon n=1 Tax=Gellertiella hungarica TaxID=1572859 RepID=A0A7W6J428_9HYPH|nr:3'-5' exonuclease [Gellertiella hungarica]MBB4063561.1 DNA polymerase-3 subunit epsilon [Gellertiella hungarica]